MTLGEAQATIHSVFGPDRTATVYGFGSEVLSDSDQRSLLVVNAAPTAGVRVTPNDGITLEIAPVKLDAPPAAATAPVVLVGFGAGVVGVELLRALARRRFSDDEDDGQAGARSRRSDRRTSRQ
jgi:hypothetical protein